MKKGQASIETELAEALSLSEQERIIGIAFRKKYRSSEMAYDVWESRPYVTNIYDGYLVASMNGLLYRVNWSINQDGSVTFQPENSSEWQRVEMEPVVVGELEELSDDVFLLPLGEHRPLIAHLEEADVNIAEGKMVADVVLIEPGFGNRRDKNYYTKELIARDAGKFKGVKMFTTEHKPGEHSVRNWVGTIIEAGKRFTKTGGAIARVAFHKESFWNELKTLGEHGLLHSMHNSILAKGTGIKGKIGETACTIVQSIDKPLAVDFVSRAGAGGHVLQLVEQYIEEGDADLITVTYLMEHRPDLIHQIRDAITSEEMMVDGKFVPHQMLKGKKKGKKMMDDEYEDEDEMKKKGKKLARKNTTKENEPDMNEEQLLAENEELKAEVQTLSEAVAKERSQRRVAIKTLKEKQLEAKLPQAAYERVLGTVVDANLSELDDEAVKEYVGGLVQQEQEYVMALHAPTKNGKVAGMGNIGFSEQEEEDEPQPAAVNVEERQTRIDAILKKYGAVI